jgi:mono/diheme cytochrome c family protein
MKSCLALALFILPALAQPAGSLGTPAAIARGDKLFAQGCAVGYCHGAGGSAARSQRLRGRSFDRNYLIKVIRDGIPNTPMPAWGDRLTDADLSDLADYIQSLANAPVDVTAGPNVDAPAPAADKPADTPEEHRAGRELFFDLTRENRCSLCHRLNGIGAPVGPDITNVAVLKVADGVQVLRYARTRIVRSVVLTGGARFPGVVVERSPAATRVYDVSSRPPVLRSLRPYEIKSTAQRDPAWRHRAAVRGYSDDELKAIWNFVRFTALPK